MNGSGGGDEGEGPGRGAGRSGSRCCLLEIVERDASVMSIDERQISVGLEGRGASVGVDNGRGCSDAGLKHVAPAASGSARSSLVTIKGEGGEGREGADASHVKVSSVVVESCRTGATGAKTGQCTTSELNWTGRHPKIS